MCNFAGQFYLAGHLLTSDGIVYLAVELMFHSGLAWHNQTYQTYLIMILPFYVFHEGGYDEMCISMSLDICPIHSSDGDLVSGTATGLCMDATTTIQVSLLYQLLPCDYSSVGPWDAHTQATP